MLMWALLLRRLREWHLYSQTCRELEDLDERTLTDINILRSDIRLVARQAAKSAA